MTKKHTCWLLNIFKQLSTAPAPLGEGAPQSANKCAWKKLGSEKCKKCRELLKGMIDIAL